MKKDKKVNKLSSLLNEHWQSLIALMALVAMSSYFIINFVNKTYANIPLLMLIIMGGIPLFLQIFWKLLRGNFGADSLAAISLITGIILQQYLAVSLIILMLASGQTLERYARQKASSVLLALINRMPVLAHRQRDNK
ncbi:MAG: heavy metal translocating P-type ATPase, partial [Legionella sp.]|nr:heavy metal translocating P-type ATPase [Legionella sp.]